MFWEKNQKRLEEVMKTLTRWYDIEVFYSGADVRDLRLSANLGALRSYRYHTRTDPGHGQSGCVQKRQRNHIQFEIKIRTGIGVKNFRPFFS